jgi:hypothetical protein
MEISSRLRLIGALVLAATGLSLGGCVNAVSVGAVNRCGADVEIKADSVSETSVEWTTLRDGGRDGVVDVPEDAETLYAWVREPGAKEIQSFDVPMTSLGQPAGDVDYDAQLVLWGDRCP